MKMPSSFIVTPAKAGAYGHGSTEPFRIAPAVGPGRSLSSAKAGGRDDELGTVRP
jgi:hypothetical protein